jgi:hypothetical protein
VRAWVESGGIGIASACGWDSHRSGFQLVTPLPRPDTRALLDDPPPVSRPCCFQQKVADICQHVVGERMSFVPHGGYEGDALAAVRDRAGTRVRFAGVRE